MKLYIESEGENFNMESRAAYVVLIDPEDRDADVALMVMSMSNTANIVTAVAKTLHSFFKTTTKGDVGAQQVLWRLFKKAYKTARFTGTTKTERAETRPIREED